MESCMKFLITGGTGFIGSCLCARLLEQSHDITVLSRFLNKWPNQFIEISSLDQLDTDSYFDVVINLAGEPIANKRWSKSQKQRITDSRLETTQSLIDFFKAASHKPKLFISGSAIGYYGIQASSDKIDESGLSDESFSSQLCQQWEATALQAQALGIRTCLLRTGIVLGLHGGALQKMLMPFKLGIGGMMGNGQQYMPWIHLDDLIGIILLCISNDQIKGAVNGTAPHPVTNRVFTKALGEALHRPTFLPMPALFIKLLMRQMGEELLLSGKNVIPSKALSHQYCFKFDHLEDALNDIFN